MCAALAVAVADQPEEQAGDHAAGIGDILTTLDHVTGIEPPIPPNLANLLGEDIKRFKARDFDRQAQKARRKWNRIVAAEISGAK